MVTEQAVLSALATINDPDIHRDIVSLGFIKGLRIDGENVAFTIELTTPACPVLLPADSTYRDGLSVERCSIRRVQTFRG